MARMLAITVLTVVMGLSLSTTAGLAQKKLASPSEPITSSFDTRWIPWLGCWQLSEEQFDRGETQLYNERATLVERTYVCVTPTGNNPGINLKAVAGSEVLAERMLVADGRRQEINEPGCVGWEKSEWASESRRLFRRSQLQCNDQPTRQIDGVSFLTSVSTWVDIQVVMVGTQERIEIRRYTSLPESENEALLGPAYTLPVAPVDIQRARREAATAPGLKDLIEANRKRSPRIVETLVVETQPRLALDSTVLITLDDAGVSSGVIDLLVALSYPDRFLIEHRAKSGSWSSDAFGGFRGGYDPIWYGPLYPYYVTPLGYRSWGGGYNPYLIGGVASPFVVLPQDYTEGHPGKAIRDRGYTRVLEYGVAGTTRVATPRGDSSGSGSSSRGRAGSGSSGTASPDGYSQGKTNTGRAAVPRK